MKTSNFLETSALGSSPAVAAQLPALPHTTIVPTGRAFREPEIQVKAEKEAARRRTVLAEIFNRLAAEHGGIVTLIGVSNFYDCRFALRSDPGFSSRSDPGGGYVPLCGT